MSQPKPMSVVNGCNFNDNVYAPVTEINDFLITGTFYGTLTSSDITIVNKNLLTGAVGEQGTFSSLRLTSQTPASNPTDLAGQVTWTPVGSPPSVPISVTVQNSLPFKHAYPEDQRFRHSFLRRLLRALWLWFVRLFSSR